MAFDINDDEDYDRQIKISALKSPFTGHRPLLLGFLTKWKSAGQ